MSYLARTLRARTLLDHITELPPREFARVCATPGKFKKDDCDWQSARDYLHDKYVNNLIDKRKGRYEPTQIVRNFWKSS